MTKNKLIKRSFWVALTLVFALPNLVQGQESNLGNWLIYIGNKQLNEKWNLHHEVQYRNYDAIGDLEQLLLRTGLGYTFGESKKNILLGYGYILSENYNSEMDLKKSVNEHRIFQQFISKQKLGKLKLSHRYRFEQRFVESDFKMRVRYFLGVNVPISSEEENKYYFSAYNELFLNTKSKLYDRNRLYSGFGYNLNKKVRLELGYMNQFFNEGRRDQLNIFTFVNL
ncbi:MAG: hypothetical protein CMP52_06610 [Flavobacteriales bacterium]|nr:hypothetical protein [Candidatus Arcticimaribacter sp.]